MVDVCEQATVQRAACTERRSEAHRPRIRGCTIVVPKIAFVTRGRRSPGGETMEHWLRNLVGPVDGIVAVFLDSMYGIVDVFLDTPLAAVVVTSALGGLIAAAVLWFR
jgi:hypothetical protein